jgi:hypothetical protein
LFYCGCGLGNASSWFHNLLRRWCNTSPRNIGEISWPIYGKYSVRHGEVVSEFRLAHTWSKRSSITWIRFRKLQAHTWSLQASRKPFPVPKTYPVLDPIQQPPFPLANEENIDAFLDEQIAFTGVGGLQNFSIPWRGQLDSDSTWIARDTKHHDPDLWEYYQNCQELHSMGSSSSHLERVDGDTGCMAVIMSHLIVMLIYFSGLWVMLF